MDLTDQGQRADSTVYTVSGASAKVPQRQISAAICAARRLPSAPPEALAFAAKEATDRLARIILVGCDEVAQPAGVPSQTEGALIRKLRLKPASASDRRHTLRGQRHFIRLLALLSSVVFFV